MASIKFLIDSSADIPADLLEGTGIEVLHFPIVVDGREYFDGQDFTPQEFYQILAQAKAIPTHSQLTPFFFVEQYEKAFSEGCGELIYTSINSKGSATNQNANQAIDMFFEEHPEARDKLRITVIDSKTYTMAYGYIVLEAAKAVKNGATADEAVAMIRDWLDHVRVLFTPYDLKYAKKSGRISAAAAVLGDALGIHPIMSFPNGDSKVLAKVRGDKALVPAMLKIAKKERKEGTPYIQIMGSYDVWNEELTAACPEALGEAPVLSYYIGGTISINAGPNVVGLIYYMA